MKIVDNVYYVGCINKELKIFDVIMETKYGTTYNAYLIKDENVTLVDTVHESKFDEYIENITKYVDIKDIKYLILNHTEPDHSGSIKKLLELNSNIEIYASFAACKNVKEIINSEFNANIVKDNEKLKLGKNILTFKIAPMLHWPDSIFTVFNDNCIFTGDFLGTHYASNNTDNLTEYMESCKYYYAAIFGPFTPFVKKGIGILESIVGIDNANSYKILPSHGPIDNKNIKDVIREYKKDEVILEDSVTIIYASCYGYTKLLAEESKSYIENKYGKKVNIFYVIEHSDLELKEAIEKSKFLMFGTPTLNRDVIKPMLDVTTLVEVAKNTKKKTIVFGSYGWTGEAVGMLETRLKQLTLDIVGTYKCIFRPTNENIEELKILIDKMFE